MGPSQSCGGLFPTRHKLPGAHPLLEEVELPVLQDIRGHSAPDA